MNGCTRFCNKSLYIFVSKFIKIAAYEHNYFKITILPDRYK